MFTVIILNRVGGHRSYPFPTFNEAQEAMEGLRELDEWKPGTQYLIFNEDQHVVCLHNITPMY